MVLCLALYVGVSRHRVRTMPRLVQAGMTRLEHSAAGARARGAAVRTMGA